MKKAGFLVLLIFLLSFLSFPQAVYAISIKKILTFESLIDRIIPDYPARAEVLPPAKAKSSKTSPAATGPAQVITQIQPKTVIKEVIKEVARYANQSDLDEVKTNVLAAVAKDLKDLKEELART